MRISREYIYVWKIVEERGSVSWVMETISSGTRAETPVASGVSGIHGGGMITPGFQTHPHPLLSPFPLPFLFLYTSLSSLHPPFFPTPTPSLPSPFPLPFLFLYTLLLSLHPPFLSLSILERHLLLINSLHPIWAHHITSLVGIKKKKKICQH